MNQRIDVKQIDPERFNPKNRLYVRAVSGRFQRLRKYGGILMLTVFGLLPFLNWHGQQAVLLDFPGRSLRLFGLTLYPQDFIALALFFMIAAYALFFVTTFLGRIWCGYVCPQTVWTQMFMWFEDKLEGPANKRRKFDQMPMNRSKFLRKSVKHGAWLAISLLTALVFVGYIVPIRSLIADFFTFQASGWIVFWVLFFTVATYGNAGWMRTIVCTHMCPYARFQSAMFDKDTLTTSYDFNRGEKRGPRGRKADPKALGLGDCIDCNLCVQVCPTGIDIRQGLQYECINCGACIDACDQVMERMNYPKGLIRYTSEHELAGGKLNILRPKLFGYGVVLLVMCGLFVGSLATRTLVEMNVIRDRNMLYRENSEGLIENVYTLKIINKTNSHQRFILSTSGLNDASWLGPDSVLVAPGEQVDVPISLALDPYDIQKPLTKFTFEAQSDSDTAVSAQSEGRFISAGR